MGASVQLTSWTAVVYIQPLVFQMSPVPIYSLKLFGFLGLQKVILYGCEMVNAGNFAQDLMAVGS